jgi:hypothetical protein
MAEKYLHPGKAPICVQKNATEVGSTANDNGGLLYFVEVRPTHAAGDPLAVYPKFAELKVRWMLVVV